MEEDVEQDFMAAVTELSDLGYPYWRARAQLDLAEWLVATSRLDEAEDPAREAEATFAQLGVDSLTIRARALIQPEVLVDVGRSEART